MTKEETLHTLRTMNLVGSVSLGLDSVIALIESLDLVEVVEVITVSDESKSLVINQLIEELDDDNIGFMLMPSSNQIMDCIEDFEVSIYNKRIELDDISIDEYKLTELIQDGVKKWLNDKLS
jgi:hypothetical protein